MSRRIYPNKRRIDNAFPIRLKVVVPPNGLGNVLSEIDVWIRDYMPPDRCTNIPVTALYCNVTASHFRTLEEEIEFDGQLN